MNEKAEKIKNKVFKINANNHELKLLSELSHEIANFKPAFKGKVKHTYILDPAASSTFGFDIFYGRPFLGVPDMLFDLFMSMRWYVCNTVENQPGLFLVYDMGVPPNNHAVGIRIHLRSARARALEQFSSLTLIRMRQDGSAYHESIENAFDLPVKKVNGLLWEKLS